MIVDPIATRSNCKRAVIITVLCPITGRVVLIRSAKRNNEIELPGGSVKPGETIEQAARRELLEETGLHLVEAVGFPRGIRLLFSLRSLPEWGRHAITHVLGRLSWVDPLGNEPRPGDDASAAWWGRPGELEHTRAARTRMDFHALQLAREVYP